jgi:Cof subfamily protein (haloacid dehalogenase superfamily)
MTEPKRRISLLLADVDGTLVDENKVLTPRAQAAVMGLHDRGIKFALTSGRPPLGMKKLVEPLAIDTPVAGFNGGVFVNPDMSVISSKLLAPDVTRTTIEIVHDHGMDAWLYTGKEWVIYKLDAPHVAREEKTIGFAPRVVSEFSDDDIEAAVKIVGVSDDYPLVAKCEADLQAALGSRASAQRSQPYYLDVTHPEANKGTVLDTLIEQLGIPREETATIGDMPNDVLMFRRSGFSIAMGNASDEVKAQASATTDGHREDGFAKAVERYILGA